MKIHKSLNQLINCFVTRNTTTYCIRLANEKQWIFIYVVQKLSENISIYNENLS